MMCTGFAGYGCADAAGRGGCATAVAIASNTDPMVPSRYRCPRGVLVEGILRRSRMDIARGVRHRQFNVRFPALLILLGNGCKWPVLKLPTFRGQFQTGTMVLGGLCHGTQGTQA